jgi:hypothetical protein
MMLFGLNLVRVLSNLTWTHPFMKIAAQVLLGHLAIIRDITGNYLMWLIPEWPKL